MVALILWLMSWAGGSDPHKVKLVIKKLYKAWSDPFIRKTCICTGRLAQR